MLLEEIENKEENEPAIEYKIFCDMDGVVADFVKGVMKIVPDYNDEQYLKDPKYIKLMWKIIGEYSASGGRLWAELDMMPDAMVLWNYISKYPTTEILSASGKPSYGAADQKHEWVNKHLGNVKTNLVRQSKEKAGWAAPNHILIDDMPKSIDPWVAAGGIGILHTSAADTINKLKELGL